MSRDVATNDDSWLARAACAGDDLELFFSGNLAVALSICAGCPVRAECLYDALTIELRSARYGVRGGLKAEQRDDVPALPSQRSQALAELREHLATVAAPEAAPERTEQTVNEPQAAPQTPTTQSGNLPIGHILTWGEEHADPEVRDQAARARADLAGLRKRHAADQELTAISSEAQELEKRLAELRAREAELTPAKTKKTRKHVDYPAAEVRAWAKEIGVHCPPVGRVPKPIVDAWRAAQSPEATSADTR